MADITRRSLLEGAVGMSVAAGLASGGVPGQAAGASTPAVRAVGADGRYPTVPLVQSSLRVGLVQTRIRMLEPGAIARIRKENLAYMLEWIDRAQATVRHDVLLFHELPLTGLSFQWPRSTVLQGCIEIPGPETEAIGAKAREHRCYIVFGAYIVDKDWPNHFISATTIIGPDGSIVDSQWKARNIMAAFGNVELMTTTIFNVLDRYVEMYGWDRVIPIARTPIGNIATSTVQLEPELYRAFGMKGAEIVMRTATGRYRLADVQGASLHNGYWSVMVNNAYLPYDPQGLRRYWKDGDWTKPIADTTTVLSTVIDPAGNLVAIAKDPTEQVISVEIPIAEHRARMRQPVVHKELYDRVWQAYTGKYPPNAFLAAQPDSLDASAKQINANLRWKP
jgi:predicted amidohydrolase